MVTGILKLAGMANIYILGDSMNSKIAERNSNFEFLRIIAMFMIVLLHSVYFGVQFKFHGWGRLIL